MPSEPLTKLVLLVSYASAVVELVTTVPTQTCADATPYPGTDTVSTAMPPGDGPAGDVRSSRCSEDAGRASLQDSCPAYRTPAALPPCSMIGRYPPSFLFGGWLSASLSTSVLVVCSSAAMARGGWYGSVRASPAGASADSVPGPSRTMSDPEFTGSLSSHTE